MWACSRLQDLKAREHVFAAGFQEYRPGKTNWQALEDCQQEVAQVSMQA